jgi:coenzyme F420-reducing hydrogenase beta subunit
MVNVSENKNCYGCGVCSKVCAKNLIEINLNSEGFYEPVIAELDKCTDCGLCASVCSYNFEQPSLIPSHVNSYAVWSKDDLVRKRCSSGGAAFEIGRTLINQGYKVCSVRYNVEKGRAEHYIASNIDDLWDSVGSKYIQSYTLDALTQIDIKEKYLFVGTPCQVDSMRRYAKKRKAEDNFVFVDFFCHGVPSMHLWNKYIVSISKKIGRPTSVSWRNKRSGWHDSYGMEIENKEKAKIYLSKMSNGDLFYNLFLSNVCLGKACYSKCKYKYISSAADIRIGDAWGKLYKNNDDGVSVAIAFSNKGSEILNQIDCELIAHQLDDIAEGQLRHTLKEPLERGLVMSLLKKKNKSITDIERSLFWYYRKEGFVKRLKGIFRFGK